MDKEVPHNLTGLPDPLLQTSLDEDLKNDPRLNAIFSQGIVVYESRLETEPKQQYEPLVLLNEVLTVSHDNRTNIDSISTQRKIYAEAAIAKSKFSYAGFSFDASKNNSLIDYIQRSTSRSENHIQIGDINISIPTILKKEIEQIHSAVTTYQQILLEIIESSDFILRPIDFDRTKSNLIEILTPHVMKLTSLKEKVNLYVDMIIARIFENIAFNKQQQFLSLLKTKTLLEHKSTKGLFIDSETLHTRIYPPTTLINDSIIGTPLNITYNLNFQQIKDLIIICFTQDNNKRMRAKFNLLSSVPIDIRNEIVLHPTLILERSILETYLDREEILKLIFSTSDSRTHPDVLCCPHCNKFLHMETNNNITHICSCPVLIWLSTTFGYNLLEDTLIIPKLVYLKPPIARYARALLRADAEKKLKPFITSNGENFKIISIDGHNKIHTLTSTGPKKTKYI